MYYIYIFSLFHLHISSFFFSRVSTSYLVFHVLEPSLHTLPMRIQTIVITTPELNYVTLSINDVAYSLNIFISFSIIIYHNVSTSERRSIMDNKNKNKK